MAIERPTTLPPVASKHTKKIPEKPRLAFAAALRKLIDAKYEGNQTKAGKALGVSQGHISALLEGNRGPGLNVLLMMRLETGRPIDEMLGFDVLPEADLERRLISSVTMEVGRLRAEIRELRKGAHEKEEPVPVSHQLPAARLRKSHR